MSLTDQIVDLAHLPANQIPEGARAKAQLSLLDWMVCGWAGRDEPLSGKLRDLAALEGGRPVAHVFGGAPGAMQVPARMAALVNGAVSHALDYDDTHFAHVGHLSVGIYPAALAVAEELDASQAQLVEAFVIGAEAAIRIGVALGAAHYNRGFHQTATAGAFGATVAAARLYGLDADQTRAAIGLCATRASGLRSQFGTMGKPYNAGIAASTGVECAQLARLGMTSALDGLTGPQGFLDTHSDATHVGDAFDLPPAQGFLFDDNKYKFHACCHGTHAMIEGLLAVRPAGLTLDDVAGVTLLTSPRWLSVCDKKAPTTGLEVKFRTDHPARWRGAGLCPRPGRAAAREAVARQAAAQGAGGDRAHGPRLCRSPGVPRRDQRPRDRGADCRRRVTLRPVRPGAQGMSRRSRPPPTGSHRPCRRKEAR